MMSKHCIEPILMRKCIINVKKVKLLDDDLTGERFVDKMFLFSNQHFYCGGNDINNNDFMSNMFAEHFKIYLTRMKIIIE